MISAPRAEHDLLLIRMLDLNNGAMRTIAASHKKTPTAPATLIINDEQAAIVREIFEMFASRQYGLSP